MGIRDILNMFSDAQSAPVLQGDLPANLATAGARLAGAAHGSADLLAKAIDLANNNNHFQTARLDQADPAFAEKLASFHEKAPQLIDDFNALSQMGKTIAAAGGDVLRLGDADLQQLSTLPATAERVQQGMEALGYHPQKSNDRGAKLPESLLYEALGSAKFLLESTQLTNEISARNMESRHAEPEGGRNWQKRIDGERAQPKEPDGPSR